MNLFAIVTGYVGSTPVGTIEWVYKPIQRHNNRYSMDHDIKSKMPYSQPYECKWKGTSETILIKNVVGVIKTERLFETPTINATSDDNHNISAEIHNAFNIFNYPVVKFSTVEIESPDENTIE